jgi:hydroxyethylthiazole kinase-like uncharacterized protein yjeF
MSRLPAPLARDAHKGDAGRVLCIAGSRTMPGAAILVARAAQRAGAGLVSIGCLDRELMQLVPVAAPEAVLLDLGASFEGLSEGDPHALLLGPGIGDDERARDVVGRFLEACPGIPRVLDADALNALRGEPQALADAAGPVVITPHPGEAGRLLGRPVPADSEGRSAAARELQRSSGAVVVLKGAGTVVCDGERSYVNDTGNPGMATAGSGDVLAGILVAYLVRLEPFQAACAAVRVHGLAGDLAAERLGEAGLVASDLIDELPAAQMRS